MIDAWFTPSEIWWHGGTHIFRVRWAWTQLGHELDRIDWEWPIPSAIRNS